MRIGLVEFAPIAIRREEPFAIARETSEVEENVFVAVHAGDLIGQGSAAANSVTGETLRSILDAFPTFVRALDGFEFQEPREIAEKMDKVLPGHPATKAAIDIAVHDALAQEAGVPLYRYLGAARDRAPTDMTIGIMETPRAVERARLRAQQGFRSLKLKVGKDPRRDLERVRAIRTAVGPRIELRLDGNEGYAWGQALSFARAAKDLDIAVLEQPVKRADFEGMRALTESSPIPIMADEMVLTPEDAKKVRWANCAHAVNLKLMKHGGLSRAADVDTICESAGYPTMVGCMGEPQLSIAAGLHFALSRKNVRWLDLDSFFNLATDPSSGLAFENGELVAPSRPGVGIDVQWASFG